MGAALSTGVGRFWRELRRRRVLQATGLYLAGCWLVLQIFDVVMEPMGLPGSVMRLAVWLTVIGFPIALFISWRYEFTADGIRRTPPESLPAGADLSVRPLDYLLVGLLVVFGVFVSASLVRLLQQDSTQPGAVEARPNSIAVLPFENMGGSPEDEYLGRGLAEDILHRLAMIEGLQVASRTAAFDLDTRNLEVQAIAQRLGVQTLLEGSVRRAGDRMRIVAQLIDGASGFHIWSRSYDRDMADLFGIYDEISAAVVRELQLTLAPEMPVFVVPPTEDMQAYDYFLQARSMLQRSTHAESTANAQRFFARAVERDPQFAEAWAGLCMSWLEWYYYQPEVAKIEQAEASCLRALELDPELAEGRAALGELYRKTGRSELAIIEYETALRLDRKTAPAWRGLGEAFAELDRDGEAEDAMRRAVDLDPDDLVNYSALGGFYFAHGRYAEAAGIYGRMAQHPGAGASAWNGQGAAFYMMGQFDRAAAAYREVVAREPSASAWSNIGSMYYYNGQYQDAVVAYREAIAQTPENPTFWGNLGDALREIDGGAEEAASAYQQAADLAEELIPVTPENVDLLANLAHYHARLGDDDRAGQYISRALFTAPDDVYAHYYAALVHLEAGRVQNALDEAARTVKLGYPRFLLEADPQFSALRSEPLFRDLMARDQEN